MTPPSESVFKGAASEKKRTDFSYSPRNNEEVNEFANKEKDKRFPTTGRGRALESFSSTNRKEDIKHQTLQGATRKGGPFYAEEKRRKTATKFRPKPRDAIFLETKKARFSCL